MDSTAVSAETFSFLTLFLRADWVIKGVMIGLALASLWSWAVILDKTFRFSALNSSANRFEHQVSGGRSLEDVAMEAGERPRHPLPRMLQAALKEWRDARARGAIGDTQAAFLIQRIDRVLDSIMAKTAGDPSRTSMSFVPTIGRSRPSVVTMPCAVMRSMPPVTSSTFCRHRAGYKSFE